VDANGNVSYSAQDGFAYLAKGQTTTETFDYTVSDKLGATDRGQATVTITGGNDAPVGADDRIVVSEEQILEAADGLLLANDRDVDQGNVLKVAGVTDNASNNGALSFTSATGRVVYNPVGKFDYLAEGTSEDVTFSYTVADNDAGTHQANVKVTVTGVNDAPVAVDDRATIQQGGSYTFDPSLNDTDVDRGDTRRVTSVTNPTGNRGTATLDPVNGQVNYVTGSGFDYLAEGEQASETYSYTVADRVGGTDAVIGAALVGRAARVRRPWCPFHGLRWRSLRRRSGCCWRALRRRPGCCWRALRRRAGCCWRSLRRRSARFSFSHSVARPCTRPRSLARFVQQCVDCGSSNYRKGA
jgi:VCBS repeat-containing protein